VGYNRPVSQLGQLIDGAAIAAKLRGEVAGTAAGLRARGIAPTLAVVLVGDDPASAVYVRSKTKAAREAGVEPRDHKLPATTSQAELLALVGALNKDPEVDGILVQMPLPAQIDTDAIIRAIDPAKDVDGLHPLSLGYLAGGKPQFVPCTPKGCMRLLREVNVDPSGKRAAPAGRLGCLPGGPTAPRAAATSPPAYRLPTPAEKGRAWADLCLAAKRLVRAGWACCRAALSRLPATT